MSTALLDPPMAKERKNTPVRIDDESLRFARIAASYKGMNLADYISGALLEVAKKDAEIGHAELMSGDASPPKRKPKAKGGAE